jgi:phosphoglycerate dehydrogenase-like enzyme
MRVLFHYAAGPGLRRRLSEQAGLDIAICNAGEPGLFVELLRDAEVLWHVLEPVTEAHVREASNLRLIQKIGVGVNTIDVDAARRHGVAVCNLPGTNSRAVAELTIALMLACLRRVPAHDREMRSGGWSSDPAVQDEIGELGGRTVGLVGYGAVARALTPILCAFGCRVLYTARSPKPDAEAEWRDLGGLLRECDVVSLHAPLSAETESMLDEAAIAGMKRGAILVNTARGALVDEQALVAALRCGHLRAAGLDVFQTEPLPGDSPLQKLPSVVLSPHAGWLTPETFDRSFALAAENCRRLAAGEPLLHRVA